MPCTTEMPIEDETLKMLTGWILKRKTANSRTKILGDANKRFFTLDFENQNFFYAHSESSKTVSLPIPFAEIVSVEAVANAECQESSAQAPAKSGRFSMPKFPKMPSRNAGWNHGIVVHGKEKKFELFLNSEEEASKWLTALQNAQRIGMTKRSGESDPDLAKAEQSTAAGSSGCSGSGSSTPDNNGSPRDCIPEVIGHGDELADTGTSRPPSSGLQNVVIDADAADPAPQPVVSELAMQQEKARKNGGSGGYRKSTSETEGVHKASRRSKDRENSPPGTSAWGQASNVPPKARYADQGAGLSLKERLERLNFSDDEEDSDSEENQEAKHTGPLNIVGAKPVERKTKTPEETVVESCEPFEALDSEDES
eukprot:gnl/MRDRNA2_/MRDRNA2_104968_c0_seq1.p1 gnl/MRDRNA2_/MRDRNA2_104968_c0~~gnl/MRDRNA2_/MRDRNA2_104968_c0_seq1.p1  ORF type:complete len:369 (-),score=91.86 gnl/MRDRNA2_/MRDRNA2_104968_c0_seq1:41-1147(-)